MPLRRLDRRMIWVDAVQMVLSLIPTFIALVVFRVEPRPSVIWPPVVVAVIGVLTAGNDLFRWLKTRYRITDDRVERRSGLLVRSTLSVPRDRIRSVDTTANLKQRIAGLRVVTIGTGQNAATGDGMIELNAVSKATAAELRRVLLADGPGAADAPAEHGEETVIAVLKRHWLLYNLVNIWAFATAIFVMWSAYWLLENFGVDLGALVAGLVDWEALGLGWTIAIAVAAVGVIGSAGLAIGFVSEFWDFRLTRVRTERGTALRTSNGLLKTREVNRDDLRLRGVHIGEPLFWRWMGAADTAVISTGLAKGQLSSEPASTILPRCPISEARRVAAAVLDDGDRPHEAPLHAHPPAALRRRIMWAVNTGLLVTGLLVWLGSTIAVLPDVLWLTGVALLPILVLAAVVAYRSLGHAIVGRYLVTRSGLLTRSTDALRRHAVIGWTLRQSLLQRRLGLITVIATTAAGYGRYRALDMDVSTGIAFADQAVPGLLSPFLPKNTPTGQGPRFSASTAISHVRDDRTDEYAGKMQKISLTTDLKVSSLGLGCSSMSHGYGPGDRDDEESKRVVHRAIELGVDLFDTADVYGPWTNELLLGETLRNHRDDVLIATKCGLMPGRDGKFIRNGRPKYLRAACEGSLRRLGTDVIDLYQLHRVDPEVPIEESWGALAELVGEGKVRALGISHALVDELDLVHKVFPVTAVQYELSVWAKHNREDVLPWCRDNGVGFLAFAPIGRGYLSGRLMGSALDERDSRTGDPRFSDAAMIANRAIVAGLEGVAARHGATPAQVAIAWALAQGDNVVPIPGTKTRRWLEENVAAAQLRLTDRDLREIEELPPSVGHMSWDRARSTTGLPKHAGREQGEARPAGETAR